MGQSSDEVIVPVVETIADALGRPIEELPPITETIDPDALDAFVGSNPSANALFTYAGLRVSVYSREAIYVQPVEN